MPRKQGIVSVHGVAARSCWSPVGAAITKRARELHAGDVVVIPAGVKHWHGAAKESWFVHIAVEVPGEKR